MFLQCSRLWAQASEQSIQESEKVCFVMAVYIVLVGMLLKVNSCSPSQYTPHNPCSLPHLAFSSRFLSSPFRFSPHLLPQTQKETPFCLSFFLFSLLFLSFLLFFSFLLTLSLSLSLLFSSLHLFSFDSHHLHLISRLHLAIRFALYFS